MMNQALLFFLRKSNLITIAFALLCAGCVQSQESRPINRTTSSAVVTDMEVGGSCEGCEAALEYGTQQLSWTDTLPFYAQGGPRIEVSGTIYQTDGKTPARDIILYLYHTDQEGRYTPEANETGWGKRHGSIRTWLRTNVQGQYKFYTLRPASYPGSTIEAHIHATIKEPGKTPYWIDEFLFDDDPFLTAQVRSRIAGRGGYTGILKNGVVKDGITHYTRDITLGMNVY